MWTLLKVLLAQWAVRRLLWKGAGSLLLLAPVAALLSTIGWPVLVILAVLALPVLLFLFVIGLPVLLVLLAGGALLAVLGAMLAIGLPILKLALIVGTPIVIGVWIARRLSRAGPPPATP